METKISDDLEFVAKQAAQSWADKLGARPDLDKYISDTLDYAFPHILSNRIEGVIGEACRAASIDLVQPWIDKKLAEADGWQRYKKIFDQEVLAQVRQRVTHIVRPNVRARMKTADRHDVVLALKNSLKKARQRVRDLQAEIKEFESP